MDGTQNRRRYDFTSRGDRRDVYVRNQQNPIPLALARVLQMRGHEFLRLLQVTK